MSRLRVVGKGESGAGGEARVITVQKSAMSSAWAVFFGRDFICYAKNRKEGDKFALVVQSAFKVIGFHVEVRT